jgi:hypothetical protein
VESRSCRMSVTFNDKSSFPFSSFFITGLQQLDSRREIDFRRRTRRTARSIAGASHVFQLDVDVDGDQFSICIDTIDNAFHDTDRGQAFDLVAMQWVRRYFKVNHNSAAIAAHPVLSQLRHKISPVGPFAPVRLNRPLGYMAPPRNDPDQGWSRADSLRRIRHARATPSVADYEKLARAPRTTDVHMAVPFYNDANLAELDEFRVEAVRAVRALGRPGNVGLVGDVPAALSDLALERVPLAEHLARLAATSVAVYLRGVHDCFSFKLCQYLALGLPMVGQPLIHDLGVDATEVGALRLLRHETADDIAEAVDTLLDDPTERLSLESESRNFYRNHVSPEETMRRILRAAVADQPSDQAMPQLHER